MTARFLTIPILLTGFLSGQEITLDQVLQKNLEAVGGTEAVRQVQTVKLTARMVIGGTLDTPMTMIFMRPNRLRSEVTVQNQTVVTVYDGTAGWMINPLLGDPGPRKLDEKAAADLANSDIDSTLGALLVMRQAGRDIQLLGREDVTGVSAFKVRVSRKSGAPATYYLDPDTYLAVKVVARITQMGQEMEVESYPSDYRQVGPLKLAHKVENRIQANTLMQMTVEKVEINPPVDEGIFRLPAEKQP